MSNYKHIDTKIIHSGEPKPAIGEAVVMPIFQTAMYETPGDDYHDIKYIRLNNTPNHDAVHTKLAALENAEAALVTASGMAAISTALLTVLKSGDHLLIQNCVYGGTQNLVTEDLPGMGIEVTQIDGADPASWESKLRPNTRAIYVEGISNPLIGVSELSAVVDFAKSHGLVSMIDNTFPTPINFRPAEWGFNLSMHSCTKYLNGHNDIVAGAVIGKTDLVERVRHKLNHLGGTLDPHAVFLLHRGIKTLAVRMRQHNESTLAIAKFLESHRAVEKVNYPGLPGNSEHERATRYFSGYSGMLSFELAGGVTATNTLLDRVRIPRVAPSLGGVESLITVPARTSHSGMPAGEREAMGIADGLVRMSVGIESTEDIIADLDQALK